MLQILDYPHLKKDGRNKIFDSLKERALQEDKKILSMDELMSKLRDK